MSRNRRPNRCSPLNLQIKSSGRNRPPQAAEALEARRLLAGGIDRLINNNTGGGSLGNFTQSETSILAFGNTVVAAYNDSGSNSGASKFTGWSYSTDNGTTWTDGGTLPTNANGDAGDPSLARDNSTGRIYLTTLQFSGAGVRVFRSDDNAVTWQAPVQGAPGKSGTQDKEWITVDNFPGPGNGNVYLIERDFGTGSGIYFFRSTDQGTTFTPNAGTLIVSGNQGAFVTVGPDHSVYAFWLNGSTSIQMRKSTDFGVTWGSTITVASGIVGGTNGDLALTGLRNGLGTFSGFRSNAFPHVVVNPVSGNLYAVYNSRGVGTDKADVFFVQSTNGGTTWSAPQKVNDDLTTTDQWQPTLAVTPDGANLGIFYYSRQDDIAANNLFRYYGRFATISGATVTFSASSAISDVPSVPEFGRDNVVNSVYMGDYNFAYATPGTFHVVWSDNRSQYAAGPPRMDPNVYYDQIVVTPVANGIWTGLAGDSQWETPGNWSNNTVPGPADDVLIALPGTFTVNLNGTNTSVKSLTLGAPGSNPTLLFAAGGTRTLTTGALTFGGNSKLDLNDEDFILDYTGASPNAATQASINSGRSGGTWTGNGITSTAARNDPNHITTLGLLEATEYKSIYGASATFDGLVIDNSALLIKYTYYGDADFNGRVNFDDYSRIDAGFNAGRTGWLNGDFNANGVVNFDDYSLIDQAFNAQGGTLQPGAGQTVRPPRTPKRG